MSVSTLPLARSMMNSCWSMTRSRSPGAYAHSLSSVLQSVSRRLPWGLTFSDEKRPSFRSLEMTWLPSAGGEKALSVRSLATMASSLASDPIAVEVTSTCNARREIVVRGGRTYEG